MTGPAITLTFSDPCEFAAASRAVGLIEAAGFSVGHPQRGALDLGSARFSQPGSIHRGSAAEYGVLTMHTLQDVLSGLAMMTFLVAASMWLLP